MSDDHGDAHGGSAPKEQSAIEKYGFPEEVAEDFRSEEFGAYVKTGFPKPLRRLRLVYESDRASIENVYYWVQNHLKLDWGFSDQVKTVDTLAAAEHSSIWGMIQQRKGIQQDRASQYLQTIGKMIQDLFKIVREIRILKERLSMYDGVKKGNLADDIGLKGYWVDMVEGGTKGQANIYTMAQQLGFGTLPDIFFSTFVKEAEDVDKVVEEKAKEFNEKVKEVLRRKLSTYIAWRKHTELELRNREKFTLRYLRQHWAIIKMYMNWIKPYLKNVQRLEAPDKYDQNPELIGSFESTMLEIEFVARRASKGKSPAQTILVSFYYRVMPKMDFHADGYQHKGPVHIGRVQFDLRCYGWTDDDVDEYIRYREQETMELIGLVDRSVRDAMDALGDELMRYLKEAGEDVKIGKEEPHHEKHGNEYNLFEPFTALFTGFKELLSFPFLSAKGMLPTKADETHRRGEGKAAEEAAKKAHRYMYLTYKNFKKQNGMINW